MGTTVLTRNVELTYEECIVCGVAFALPATMRKHAYERGGYFYCPNGHSQGWDNANCKTAAEKMKAEIARLESQVAYKTDQLESQKRQVSTAKGQLTKIQKRIGNGVCPCCNRHFVNVQRHMKTKHPEADLSTVS